MDYGEVEWCQVKNPTTAKFHPEFLHPLHSVMRETDISAHLTALGDIIVMNRGGLLAARRQRKWKLYDVGTFENSLSRCLGNSHVGGNLFEVIFELSFRRQGALFVYDPDHCIQRPHPQYGKYHLPGLESKRRGGRRRLRPGPGGAVAGRHGRGKEGRLGRPQAAVDRNGLRRRRPWSSTTSVSWPWER